MEFIEYANEWAKNEVYQGKIMIAIGIVLAIAFILICRNDNEFLRGMLIPLGLLLAILLGYGSYILYSRPAHAKEIITIYKTSPEEAVKLEIAKHEKDNKAGKLLIRIYPILTVISIVLLFFASSLHYRGMALGSTLLFVSAFLIDSGFVSRSDAFLLFLKK